MAVAERVVELEAPLEAQESFAQEKTRGRVIEFDPSRTPSHGSLADAEPGAVELPRTWLYDGIEVNEHVKAALSRRRAAHMPLPMEDVCLPVKALPNRSVRRAADPRSGRKFAERVFTGIVMVLLIYIGWGAHSALRQTGYDAEKALTQQQQLANENRHLRVDYAERNDPTRILRMATEQGFVVPQAAQVAWQTSPAAAEPDGSRVVRAAAER